MLDIDQIFEMLSSYSNEGDQSKGIEEAKKIRNLSVLIQPMESKSLWENCAKVLATKSDELLDPYLVPLFEWLQDMNWPGADIIYNRLKIMPATYLEVPFQISLSIADKNNDKPWKEALLDFKEESTIISKNKS